MRIFIGKGKVAQVLARPGDTMLSSRDIDVTNQYSVDAALGRFPHATAVINTAAKINLEWCEANKAAAWEVNALGAEHVGRTCRALGLPLVHFSSGCIFDGGERAVQFWESSIPTPACHYAATKAEADLRLLSLGLDQLIILRPRQLFSAKPYATNVITKFLGMDGGRFIDTPNSATCIEDLNPVMDTLLAKHAYGVFNTVNDGLTSPYAMACAIRDKLKPSMVVEQTSYEEYLSTIQVKRVNTRLSMARAAAHGAFMRPVAEAFQWALDNYGKEGIA